MVYENDVEVVVDENDVDVVVDEDEVDVEVDEDDVEVDVEVDEDDVDVEVDERRSASLEVGAECLARGGAWHWAKCLARGGAWRGVARDGVRQNASPKCVAFLGARFVEAILHGRGASTNLWELTEWVA